MPNGHAGFSSSLELYLYGPTLRIQVGFDAKFIPGKSSLNLPEQTYPALVDTGASISCIDSELAIALQLPLIDRENLSGVDGSSSHNMYMAQIRIPSLNFIQYGKFAGVHLRAGGQPHFALLGRSLLEHFEMTYNGSTGAVRLVNLS